MIHIVVCGCALLAWRSDMCSLTDCRDPAQKWQLAAACFKHCQLALAALASCPPITAELLARPPPGLAVLISLMGGRHLEKALLQHVLAPGQDELAVRE